MAGLNNTGLNNFGRIDGGIVEIINVAAGDNLAGFRVIEKASNSIVRANPKLPLKESPRAPKLER